MLILAFPNMLRISLLGDPRDDEERSAGGGIYTGECEVLSTSKYLIEP